MHRNHIDINSQKFLLRLLVCLSTPSLLPPSSCPPYRPYIASHLVIACSRRRHISCLCHFGKVIFGREKNATVSKHIFTFAQFYSLLQQNHTHAQSCVDYYCYYLSVDLRNKSSFGCKLKFNQFQPSFSAVCSFICCNGWMWTACGWY